MSNTKVVLIENSVRLQSEIAKHLFLFGNGRHEGRYINRRQIEIAHRHFGATIRSSRPKCWHEDPRVSQVFPEACSDAAVV